MSPPEMCKDADEEETAEEPNPKESDTIVEEQEQEDVKSEASQGEY
jgi:hypothetical protein